MFGREKLQMQIDELKEQVRRLSIELEDRTSLYVWEPGMPRAWGNEPMPRISHRDAIVLIERHLGLRFEHKRAQCESWSLVDAKG